MSRIVLSTSSSGLDDMDIQHNVELIRLRIHINNVEFIDGQNISSQRLQALMNSISHSPVHTSPAPSSEIALMFTKLVARGFKEVFVTSVSSQISESYNIIKQVAESFKDKLKIYVYDTKDLNACEALLALEADRMMQQGQYMPDIAAHLDMLRRGHLMLFAADDLSYLIKNKKIANTAGFIANLMSIKPVLKVTEEGKVASVIKIRKIDKALKYLVDEVEKAILRPDCFVYALSAGRPDLDNHFLKMIKERTGIENMVIMPVSAISLANHGPSGVGLGIFYSNVPEAAKLYKAIKLNNLR